MRKRLSPRVIKAIKPGKDGIRHGAVIMDDVVPNLGVRILGTADQPRYTFVLVKRFPGNIQPSNAALGTFDRRDDEASAASLRAARRKAVNWLAEIEQGRNPLREEERQREAAIRQQAQTFGAVAEDFIREKLPSERRGGDVELELRREFKRWWNRPIGEINDEDIISVIRAKAKTAPSSARNIFGNLRRLFQWTIDQRTYGLKVNPCSTIKLTAIVGEKVARDRVLNDDELRAFWRAAERTPYPAGAVYQFLILAGLRLGEVSDA